MEIILKQDIPNLGYKNDLVNVKGGYGRNFLVPQGMAIIASETNKKIRAEEIKQKTHKEEKFVKEAEDLKKALEAVKLRIPAKSGTSGKIFGSLNALQIAEALKEEKFEINRKMIDVDGDSIKELGDYTAKIKLYKNIHAEVKFEVFGE